MTVPMRNGMLVILSAPSGTGKSTICRKLLARRAELRCSVSATTRRPRPGEREGKHYFFLDAAEFKRRIARGEFLEWALVHDHYYGTPRRFIESAVGGGADVLLAIDVQGAAAIRRKRGDSVLIFVVPPSLRTLRRRIAARRAPDDDVAKRLADSRQELEAAKSYDYLVVNDDLDRAVREIDCIITAERLRVERQRLEELIAV
ncbi:MAG: guanylate kinase [Elusimicrobia bacterium]|nr:guanylate kinase [Elusimicrobiota bacterium]MDE2425555.1 guanylate kinase [Elusimicrobiota bacterium]